MYPGDSRQGRILPNPTLQLPSRQSGVVLARHS